MEILVLDTETFNPIDILKNYESFVWDNRFSEAGSFSLVTYDIDNTMKKIPPRTFIGNDEDLTMMYIEKHSIDTDEAGVPKLTVYGRGAEAFFESRITVGDVNKGTEEYRLSWSKKRVPDLVKLLILDADIPTSEGNNLGYDVKFPFSLDANLDVGPILPVYEPERGTLYRNISELTKAYGFSFEMRRSLNPSQNHPTIRVRPGVIRKDVGNNTFQYQNGDISSQKYTHDITDLADMVYAFTPIERSGFGRAAYRGDHSHRVKMIDRSESEPKDLIRSNELLAFDPAFMGTTTANVYDSGGGYVGSVTLPDVLAAFGKVMDALNQLEIRYYQRDVAVTKSEQYYRLSQYVTQYSFEISPNANAKFGVNYDLGDVVRVQPSWGESVQMRVDGYIRSNDGDGYKAYPELTEYRPLADKIEQEEL